MKKSRLKEIIREEYQTVTNKSMITEDIIDALIKLFLDPVLMYKAKKLSQDPEWIELQRQAKIAKQELETKTKNLKLAIQRIEDEERLKKQSKAKSSKKK